jgi:uncharacterized pyridoxal phosphate-containing UPF0001 family protein
MSRPNEFLHKVQHLFTGRRCFGGTWAFIQSVQDNKNRELSWQSEHILETCCKSGTTRLLGAFAALEVQLIKNIPAPVRVADELEEDGRQHAADVTL